MAYTQFGYTCPSAPSLASSQLLGMSGTPSTPPQTTVATSCCESGRPIMTDPNTGQTVCSCQYSSSLLSYPRVAGVGLTDSSIYSSAYATQGYVPFGADPSAFYSPLNGYDLKDNADAWRSLAHPTPCYPYDPTMTGGYPYGQSALAQRKNATREATSTLKAWLQEHIKNPYPTKGEKIMLAIITKMTLTQVSTWFANARRRLKKENKMTWSPRNRSDEDGNKLDSDDEDGDDKNDDDNKNISSNNNKLKDNHDSDDEINIESAHDNDLLSVCGEDSSHNPLSDVKDLTTKPMDSLRTAYCSEPTRQTHQQTHASLPHHLSQCPTSPLSIITSNSNSPSSNSLASGSSCGLSSQDPPKPRIWSLADVATSSSPSALSQRTSHPQIHPHMTQKSMNDLSFHNGFRPWVNGSTNPYNPLGTTTSVVGPHSQTNGQTSGLLRPYALAPRTEVH